MLPVVFLLVTSAAVLSSQAAWRPSAEIIEADFIPHDPNRSPCREVSCDSDSLPVLQGITLSSAVTFDLSVEGEKKKRVSPPQVSTEHHCKIGSSLASVEFI